VECPRGRRPRTKKEGPQGKSFPKEGRWRIVRRQSRSDRKIIRESDLTNGGNEEDNNNNEEEGKKREYMDKVPAFSREILGFGRKGSITTVKTEKKKRKRFSRKTANGPLKTTRFNCLSP